jgi:hypothetical protein
MVSDDQTGHLPGGGDGCVRVDRIDLVATRRRYCRIPPTLQDRTILLYRDEDLWKQRLQVVNERRACVLPLGPTRVVQWMTPGSFAEAHYWELMKSIRALK